MQGHQADSMIRVLVADSTQIHTQLLADALKRDRHLEVVASTSHSRDLLEAAVLQQADVVILSSHLDEEPLRGLNVVRQLRLQRPEARCVVLLDCSKADVLLEAFRAGAKGVFSRHESLETLCKCVRRVHEGQIWANSQQMTLALEALAAAPTVRAVSANGLGLLSKRELEVVQSLAEGLTNREIAERLGLSQHTIKNYLFRIFDKLGVSSRIELLFLTLSQPNTQQNAPKNGNGAAHSSPDWHKNAAEQGLPAAQAALAEMYASGKGLPKDNVAAYMWYLVSEKSHLEMAEQIVTAKRQLAEQLTAEEILEAQRKAAERLKKVAKSAAPRTPQSTQILA
ncbi:MAG: response regulator [Acidobacteria bacterium]|nr:response regulator [Acidobacteriota bacterium]